MIATLCGGLLALGQPVTRYVSSAIGASGDGLAGSSGAGRPTTDIRGYARDATPDEGAYEFGASAPEGGPSPVVTALRTVNLYIK